MKKILFFMLSLGFQASLFGMNITELKDIDTCVNQKYEHLSLLIGCNAIESGLLKNYYNFAPGSATRKLLEMLCYLKDENIDKSTHMPTSKFTLDLIAKIIATIEAHSDAKNNEPDFEKLTKALISVIDKKFTKGTYREKFVINIIDSLKQCGYGGSGNQLYPKHFTTTIFLGLAWLLAEKKEDCLMFYATINEIITDFSIKKLPENLKTSVYEKTEITSADYIFDSINTKIKNIIEEKEDTTLKIQKQLELDFEQLSYAIIFTQNYTGTYPKFAMHGPLRTGALVNSTYFTNLSEIEQKKLIKETMPSDCMENVIRMMLNLSMYNTKTKEFDIKMLPKGFSKESSGIKFYTDNNKAWKTVGFKMHADWGDLLSDIPGILYCRRLLITEEKVTFECYDKYNNGKPYTRPTKNDYWYYYEVEPTVTNFLKIVNHLFGYTFSTFEELLKAFNSQCWYKNNKKDVKWIEYAQKDICDTRTMLKIVMPNECGCIIELKPSHAEIKYMQIDDSTSEYVDIIKNTLFIGDKSNIKSCSLMQLFPPSIEKQTKFDGRPVADILYYCMLQPLNSAEEKQKVLEILAELIKVKPNYGKIFYSIINRLLVSIRDHNDATVLYSTIMTLIDCSLTDKSMLKNCIYRELTSGSFSGIHICTILKMLMNKKQDWSLSYIKSIAKKLQSNLDDILQKSNSSDKIILYRSISDIHTLWDKDWLKKIAEMLEKSNTFNKIILYKSISDMYTVWNKDWIQKINVMFEKDNKNLQSNLDDILQKSSTIDQIILCKSILDIDQIIANQSIFDIYIHWDLDINIPWDKKWIETIKDLLKKLTSSQEEDTITSLEDINIFDVTENEN